MNTSTKHAPDPALAWLRWKIWLWWLVANIAGYPLAGALFGLWQWRGLRHLLARGVWWTAAGIVGLVVAAKK